MKHKLVTAIALAPLLIIGALFGAAPANAATDSVVDSSITADPVASDPNTEALTPEPPPEPNASDSLPDSAEVETPKPLPIEPVPTNDSVSAPAPIELPTEDLDQVPAPPDDQEASTPEPQQPAIDPVLTDDSAPEPPAARIPSAVLPWPSDWLPGGSGGSTTALPTGASIVPVSGGAYAYLVCADTGRCYLHLLPPDDLTTRTFTIILADLLATQQMRDGGVTNLVGDPDYGCLGRWGNDSPSGTVCSLVDDTLSLTVLPNFDWSGHPGIDMDTGLRSADGRYSFDLYAQVVAPPPAEIPSCFTGPPAPYGENYPDIPGDPASFKLVVGVGETVHFTTADLLGESAWTEAFLTDTTELGPLDPGNASPGDLAAWTPTEPGAYEFSYSLGTLNCASPWFTGTITVVASDIPVVVPPTIDSPVVTPLFVDPPAAAAPSTGQLAHTGTNVDAGSIGLFALGLMMLGGLALVSIRGLKRTDTPAEARLLKN